MSLDVWVTDAANAKEMVWNTQDPTWDALWWTLATLASNSDLVAVQGVTKTDQGVHILYWAPPKEEP